MFYASLLLTIIAISLRFMISGALIINTAFTSGAKTILYFWLRHARWATRCNMLAFARGATRFNWLADVRGATRCRNFHSLLVWFHLWILHWLHVWLMRSDVAIAKLLFNREMGLHWILMLVKISCLCSIVLLWILIIVGYKVLKIKIFM